MDLTFILDFSGSMDDLFDIVIVFAREVTQGLPFQLGGLTRVAVVTYETGGEVQFYLDEYTTKLQVLNALVFRYDLLNFGIYVGFTYANFFTVT